MPEDNFDSSDPLSGMRGCMRLGETLGTIVGAAVGACLTHKLGESYTLDVLAGAPVGGVAGYWGGKITGLVFHGPIISSMDLVFKGIAATLYAPFYFYEKGENLVSYIKNCYYERRRKVIRQRMINERNKKYSREKQEEKTTQVP